MDVSTPSFEPHMGYFALSENARAASLVPPPEGRTSTDGDLGLGSNAQPRTVPDAGLPKSDKEAAMAASPSVAAFIDAMGRGRVIQSLTPQADNAPNPERAASTPVESAAEPKAERSRIGLIEEGHTHVDISEAQNAALNAGSDPMLCDSPKEKEAPPALASTERDSNAVNIVQPPGLGTRFRSREEFKNACQNHALSLSAADPHKRFHFATRTSALGKWLVFSCHQHIKGCPVAVRVELDKSDQSWVVTSANYDHSHFSYVTSVTTQPDVSTAAIPRKQKASRRFSIVRKKSDAPPTSFSREASAALTDATDGETTDSSSIPAVRRKPRARRAHSDTGVAHRPQKTRHLVPDGDARAAFLKQQKRNLHRLSTPPAQPQLESIAASPRIKSDRERGTSLQHNTSHSRACSEAPNADAEGQPPSPTDSVGSGYMGRPRSYSVISADRKDSHLAVPSIDPFTQHSTRLFGWGSAPRRSPSPEPLSHNMSLGEYLGTLHTVLSDLQEPFHHAGVTDVSMLLSLERQELDNVVDSFAGDQASSLQRMLAKNRIGRALL